MILKRKKKGRIASFFFFFNSIYIYIHILTRDVLLIARVPRFAGVGAGDAFYFSVEMSMLPPVQPHAGGYWRPCSRWKVKLFKIFPPLKKGGGVLLQETKLSFLINPSPASHRTRRLSGGCGEVGVMVVACDVGRAPTWLHARAHTRADFVRM